MSTMNNGTSEAGEPQRRYRAVSHIMALALGVAVTLGVFGTVAYFINEEINVLTTQEGFTLGTVRLLKVNDADVLTLSVKNTGTTSLEDMTVTLQGVCKENSSDDRTDAAFKELATLRPAATYSISSTLDCDSMKTDKASNKDYAEDITVGTTYIASVRATAAGTDSEINDVFTVTSKY